jgi:hypothetical protein
MNTSSVKEQQSSSVYTTSEAQSTTGAMRRHGPHQSATKSTRTGSSDSSTSAGNSPCAMNLAAAAHRTRARGHGRVSRPAGAARQPGPGERRSAAWTGSRVPRGAEEENGERGEGGRRVDAVVVLGADAMGG